jgi:transcription initiation factor IIF auxiliary subunit
MMTNSRLANTIFTVLFHLSLVLAICIPDYALAQDVRIENTAKYVGSGRYEWTVFLVAEAPFLKTIKYVEYTLHPSIPNPVQIIRDHDTNFALSSNGWGEFNIFVKIVFKNGRKMYFEHWLNLEERSEEGIEVNRPPLPEYGEINADNTARHLNNRVWEWTVFIETDEETLSQIEYVEYILHPTFPEPVRRVFKKDNNFALTAKGWGTFEIKIRVVFKDRTERHLTHVLEFEQQQE